jgi:hypothetical protein
MKISLLLLLSCAFITSLYAQNTKIDGIKLRGDFVLFRESLKKEHAGLYRYKTRAELDRVFDSCYAMIDRPLTALEFGKTLMYVISSIEDGHTRCGVFRLLAGHYGDKMLFPFYPYFSGDRAFVLCGSIPGLPPGTEIVSVDGYSIPELKKNIFRFFPSDGSIETKKMIELNDGAFPILYGWLYGEKDSFNVSYRSGSDTKRITIAAQPVKDLVCKFQKNPAGKKPLQLDIVKEGVALLTIKAFNPDKQNGMTLNFRDFIDSAFNEIAKKKIKDLVIDLRWNGGGADELGALLYSYLAKEPFGYFASKGTVTKQVTIKENPLLGVQQPRLNTYLGRVYFLINGSSFSTTADFCAIAKSHNRGLFIGEETGGGYYGNTSGTSVTIQLLASGITVTIPQYKYVNAVTQAKYPDRGTLADYQISPRIEEVLGQVDVPMLFVFELIKKSNSQ